MKNIKVETAAIINSLLQYISQSDIEIIQEGGVSLTKENLENEKRKYLNNQCCVLFAGEIKTGKSSLINNLITEDICTVDAGVCTNVNTVIKYGPEERITVYFNDGKNGKRLTPKVIDRDSIDSFVSEKGNKNNKENVQLIEVEIPSDYFRNGSLFVDTPGLGSLNPYHAATTFSIVPQADIVVFVSSAASELTEDEQEYAQKILACSRCQAFVHVLTNADNGDPAIILSRNNEYFKKILSEENIPYYSCAVSNSNFKLLRQEIINDIKDTGFDKLFNILSSINERSENFLTHRVLSLCSYIIEQYLNQNQILLNSINDPEIAKKRQKELEDIKERLNSIRENKETWNINLSTKISQYRNSIDAVVRNNFNKVKGIVEDKLSDEYYLENPDRLGSIISSEIVIQTTVIQKDLEQRLINIYSEICEESGLNIVRSGLRPTHNPEFELTINKPKVDSVAIYRNSIGSRLFIYGIAGTVIGAAVGGIVGTVFFPGVGTMAGAELGAQIAGGIASVCGPIVGLINGKKKKIEDLRKQILSKVNPSIAEEQSNFMQNIKDSIASSEGDLKIAFNKAIKEEDSLCKKQILEITEAINGETSRREKCKTNINTLTKFQVKITEILSAVVIDDER